MVQKGSERFEEVQTVLGMHAAVSRSVAARKHQELVAWQLASKLRQDLVPIVAMLEQRRQFKLCEQLADAARSVPSNIAEGFKRYLPRDFANFLRYSRASLAEIGEHLHEAHEKGLLTEEQFAELSKLTGRTAIATARLHAYLERCDPKSKRRSMQERTSPEPF